MSKIQIGDIVYSSTSGYESNEPGTVRSFSGAFATVEFSNRTNRLPVAQLSTTSPGERRRLKAQAEEEERHRAEQERRLKEQAEEEERRRNQQLKELARIKAEEKEAVLSVLRKAMVSNFLDIDALYKSNYSDVLALPDFLEAKSSFARQWIANDLGQAGTKASQPDAEQSIAISSLHGNVQVVARAGSGKTTTLVHRTIFLLKHCKVAPSEILLLAFNRKAVIEIRRRLLLRLVPEAKKEIQREIDKARRHSKGGRQSSSEVDAEAAETVAEKFAGRLPHVMTFHALAYAIVHPQGQILVDGQDSDSLGLSRVVQDVIDEFLHNPTTRDRIRNLMMNHFREDWDRIVQGGFNLGMDDLLALKRSLPRETLGGELVKSRGEKVIADFLFEHDITYKYERNHWWSGVNYKPDFTIFLNEKSGVIIEYFGMVGDPKYDRQTEEKQKYWAAKNEWSLISIFPSDLAGMESGAFQEWLASKLKGHGIRCQRLNEEDIWLRVRHRAVDRFTRAATSFIGRCRKKSWSAEELAEHAASHESSTNAEAQFINLISEIFPAYLDRLDRTGADDFDGLLQKAAEAIKSGSTAFLRKSGGGDIKRLRFVCIDEFQDFSELFHRLVDAMRKANERLSFFCVGDDWQAINGFAGSELRFFEKFPDYFADSSKLNVSTNYRSARKIVEVGNVLMAGLGTLAQASKVEIGDAWICDMSKFEPSLIEKQRHPGDLITPIAARLAYRFALEGRQVVFLARRNGLPWYFNTGDKVSSGRGLDDFLLRVQSFLPEDLHGMASISTAHKYKGLEKPAVVVLDAVARSYPLVHPDWPFFRIFGDSPMSLASDDRRLFYVALTRAVESLVVITDSGAKSPFLEEISSRRALNPLPWGSFPSVPDGRNPRLLIKIEDAAGASYGSQTGTFPIKDLLHACKYQYNGVSKRWEKSISQKLLNLGAIQAEAWAVSAMDVAANFYDDSETLLASYRISHGRWSVEVDNWALMRQLSADGLKAELGHSRSGA